MQAKTFEVLTVSLDQCLIEGPSRVGIKAWRLAQLDSYGYKVPPALIIPADEVVRIWKDGQLIISDEIVSDLWHYSCKRLEAGSLIVRSSGQEDGEKLSFAGQFKSITDVNSVEEFKEALRSCIASSESGSIQNYSKVMNGKNYSEGYSVMIMPQRDCVFSGILFSEVHVNGNESDLIVLQVTHGNNFGLTSGSESGDILYIDKLDGSIICSIPQKRKVAGFDSVTVERLYNMALALETKFGFSVDLEWGVMLDGTIELFQVRPITTLNSPDSSNVRLRSIIQTDSLMKASLLSLKDRHISLDVNYWSDQNIAELITDQPSRMAFGIFTYIFAHGDGAIKIGRNQMGYDIGDELTDGFFELIGGRPRCSIIHDALTYRVKGIPLDDYVSGFISRYLDKIKNNVQYANYPEVVLYEQNPAQDSLIEMFGSEKGEQYAKYYQNFFDRVNQLEKTVVEEFKLSFEPSFIK
ncbi:MAG: PEP/pyruvate-binding domain-containing protein, partial [Bacteroidales bacterium]